MLQISESSLQRYVNATYRRVPQRVTVLPKKQRALTIQMDELCSFVDSKGNNKQWVWLALDVQTREIIGCHISDRSSNSAQSLWASLPGTYRQCAVIFTSGDDNITTT